MWEQGVLLKHRVHRPFMGRDSINPHTVKKYVASGGRLETTDNAQSGGLAASTGTEQCEELLVMDIQRKIGADIIMAFDECPSSVADRDYVQKSVDRTTRWLARCKAEMARLNSLPDTINKEQLLFGINQGAVYEDIRIEHAKAISEMDLDGYAVGGLAVGETHEEMYRILDAVVPYLPQNKPTYLMGVGTPANILEGVELSLIHISEPTRRS